MGVYVRVWFVNLYLYSNIIIVLVVIKFSKRYKIWFVLQPVYLTDFKLTVAVWENSVRLSKVNTDKRCDIKIFNIYNIYSKKVNYIVFIFKCVNKINNYGCSVIVSFWVVLFIRFIWVTVRFSLPIKKTKLDFNFFFFSIFNLAILATFIILDKKIIIF